MRCSAICRSVGAKIVTKGKSMIAEEIALNEHLEANGITPVETDLGEYIIQLRHEPPSHIIAPAIHLMKEQVADTFRAAHTELDPARPLERAARSCATRRARCCGRNSSPPMSASPAPISSSPKPAPASSSPTRATAI